MNPPLALLAGVLTGLVPLVASLWLLGVKAADRPRELARLLVATALAVVFLTAAPWVWLTYWMRPVTAVVLALGVVRSIRRLHAVVPAGTSTSATAILMVMGAPLIALDVAAIRGSSPTADVIALQFPLRDGTFVILQGGRSAITNPFHYANPAGRLALEHTPRNEWMKMVMAETSLVALTEGLLAIANTTPEAQARSSLFPAR